MSVSQCIKVHVVKYPDRTNLVLRWECPETGKVKTKSAGTHRQKDAERAAAKLEEQIAAGEYGASGKFLWETFRQRYEDDYVSGLANRTANSVQTSFNAVERICGPRKLTDLTSARKYPPSRRRCVPRARARPQSPITAVT